MKNKEKISYYKYYSIREQKHKDRFIKLIKDNIIYFSKCSQLNDPFEYKFTPSSLATTEEKIRRYAKHLKQQNPYLSQNSAIGNASSEFISMTPEKLKEWEQNRLNTFNDILYNKTGLFSMSEIRDDIIMWSHYSDSHSGICVEFTTTVENDPSITFLANAFKVVYEDIFPVVNLYKTVDIELVKKVILTKSKHWEYEKERRIVLFDKGYGEVKIPKNIISSIIMGHNIDKDDIEFIKKQVLQYSLSIKLLKAEIQADKYALEIKPFERDL